MPLFWAVSFICFGMLKVKFWCLGSHCAEKSVAIKQSKLSFDRCDDNFFGMNSSSFLLPNTVCSMRSELSPLRLNCWA